MLPRIVATLCSKLLNLNTTMVTVKKVYDYKYKHCDLRIWFKRDSSTSTNECFVLHEVSFPHHLLYDPSSHARTCNGVESKTIRDHFLILNHPYFFECFELYLSLNTIAAIHMKPGKLLTTSG